MRPYTVCLFSLFLVACNSVGIEKSRAITMWEIKPSLKYDALCCMLSVSAFENANTAPVNSLRLAVLSLAFQKRAQGGHIGGHVRMIGPSALSSLAAKSATRFPTAPLYLISTALNCFNRTSLCSSVDTGTTSQRA